MKNVRLKILTVDVVVKGIYVIVFVAIIAAAIFLNESEEFTNVLPVEEDGDYRIHTKQLVPREFPETIIPENGKIYCFFLEAELINVYGEDGEYLYGIQYADGRNGKSEIICRDGRLYIDARTAGIYVFEGTELVRFEKRSASNELKAVFDGTPNAPYPYFFVTDTNAIMRGGGEEAEIVVQLPHRKYDPISFLALGALMLLLGEVIWKKGKVTA